MSVEQALHSFAQHQNGAYRECFQSEFCEEIKQSSFTKPFQWIGCHYAGKSQMAYLACQEMVFCHVNQNNQTIWTQAVTYDSFVNHLADMVFRAESPAYPHVAMPVSLADMREDRCRTYLNVVLGEKPIIFIFSFRHTPNAVYHKIDTWLREFLSKVENNRQAHIIYTAWPRSNPFGKALEGHSRHTGKVTPKPVASNGSADSVHRGGANSIYIPCPLAPDKAYEIFCTATDSKFPELTQEVLADWYGGHLGAILFLAKAIKEYWTADAQGLSLVERIKESVRGYSRQSEGEFPQNLRLSVGYDPKTRKTPDGIPTKEYGLHTSNGRYIRLLEYGVEPIDCFYSFRKFTVRLPLEDTPVSGIVIQQQSQWYVLTCSHCVPQETTDTAVIAFNDDEDRAFVMHRTGNDNSINDMALLALKPGPVVAYLTSLGISPPELQDLKVSANTICYSFGYGTITPNHQPREASWGQETIGEFQAVNMQVQVGDSGSPIWYWDNFDFFIAGMVVKAGVGNEAGVIQADRLYQFVQSVLRDSEKMDVVQQWRNE